MQLHRARFSWNKRHRRRASINFIKLNDTNTLAICWIKISPRRVVVLYTYNLFRFSHSYISCLHSDNLSSDFSVREGKMFSMKKNKLLVSINNYIQGMLVIWKIEYREVPRKKNEIIIYERYCHKKIRGSEVNKIDSYLVFRQFLKNIWGTYSMLKCCDTWIMLFHKLRRMDGAN